LCQFTAHGLDGFGRLGDGTIFSLSVGLGPFVETNPTSGKVGAKVTILGNNLTGSTSVTFNGVAVTSFTVNSTGTAITTTVPSGATTGKVQVTTASGTTLTSNVKFRVP
jgi:IPT/TIG domain